MLCKGLRYVRAALVVYFLPSMCHDPVYRAPLA